MPKIPTAEAKGARGPAGPQGPEGPMGPAGPAGEAADAASIEDRLARLEYALRVNLSITLPPLPSDTRIY